MKKILIILIILIFIYSIFIVASHYYEQRMFNNHVIENSLNKINILSYNKYDLGMHSPFVFKFKIKKNRDDLIKKIIEKYHLKKENRIPYIIKKTPFIIKEEDINLFELMKKYPFYIILYETKYDSGERILIIVDNYIIFHSTGYAYKEDIANYGYWYNDDNELKGKDLPIDKIFPSLKML